MLGSALDRALGIHDDAMILRTRRSTIIASNIANADTPNYKARDIDFKSAIHSALNEQKHRSEDLTRSHSQHLSVLDRAGFSSSQKLYRIPIQPSLDGNTVDSHVEYTEFAENTMRYEAGMQFLSGKFKSLRLAIKGQ